MRLTPSHTLRRGGACRWLLLVLMLRWHVTATAQSPPATRRPAEVDTLAVLLQGSRSVHHLTPVAAGGAGRDSVEAAGLPQGARARLGVLNVKDADLRDVFRSIAHEHNLNIIVDNRIDRRVTIRLVDVPVLEALAFLCERNGLLLQRSGRIFRVDLPPQTDPPPPVPPKASVRDGRLTVDLHDDDLEQVLRLVGRQSGTNLLVRRGVRGTLTGALRDVPLDQGLRTLLRSNGFSLREKDGIYHVDRLGLPDEEVDTTRSYWVDARDSLVALDVTDAPIGNVLREIAVQMGINLITYDLPQGTITATADSLSLDQSFDLLLKRSNVTYRKAGSLYVVGDRQTRGIAATRLIRLHHIRADAVLELIPQQIRDGATIQVVKEHNGLMVTGTNDQLVELDDFVREVDHPTPQILIEALVVDFETNDLFELGLSFGRDAETAAAEATAGYRFNGSFELSDDNGFSISADGRQTNDVLGDLSGFFGIGRIGRLPSDFFVHIHALSIEGKVNIRSRPQIATLNGHTASLRIGTTQYYILRSETPYQNPNQVVLQQSQRFEKIEANVRLEITPWVSTAGEITADIRPEFSMPVGEFSPDVPPTINSRVLESTVRLRDGETIILGGLIQEEEQVVHHKVPLLGSLPLLGRLFRSRSKESRKSELIIFLTPHVFYGDERDAAKWGQLKDELDLKGLKDGPRWRRLLDPLQ